MEIRFSGKVVIVTGSGQGIGGVTARAFARAGATVAVVDLDAAAAREQAAEINDTGGTASVHVANVGDTDALAEVYDAVSEQHGRLDVVVNNAWGHVPGSNGSALEITEDGWDASIGLMLKPIVFGARFAARLMKNGGSIVNVASVHGLFASPHQVTYDTGKAAVIAATRQIALDLGRLGVRVNSVCPGHIVTEKIGAYWQDHAGGIDMFDAQYPVGRVGRPEEIANAILFLASDAASFISGHALVVDGGLSIQLQEDLGIAQAKLAREHPEYHLKRYPFEERDRRPPTTNPGG